MGNDIHPFCSQAGKMKTLPPPPAHDRSSMHGDLLNGLCYLVVFPLYSYLYLSAKFAAAEHNNNNASIEENDPSTSDLTGPRNIVIAFAFSTVFSWLSWWRKSPLACFLAFCGMSAVIGSMNLYRWPHHDEVVVLPQFVWSLLIISANSSGLHLGWMLLMDLVAVSTALLVAFYSPLLNFLESLPILLGFTSAHVLFHYFHDYACKNSDEKLSLYYSSNKEGKMNYELAAHSRAGGGSGLFTAHAASLVLAGTFAYHMSSELVSMMTMPGYAKAGGYSILKAGFFAAVGLAAAGAFRREIDIKESLEVLVEERAKQIVQQADKLRMVGFAVEASETAIAITDSMSRVLWLNPALEKVAGKSSDQLLHACLIQALPFSQADKDKFVRCFNETGAPNEAEIVLQVPAKVKGCSRQANMLGNVGMETARLIINAQVSRFPLSGGEEVFNEVSSVASSSSVGATGSRFVVILKDITEQRARERAEKAAEQEALLARAMSDSMEMLSHELRTPLQGIMGMTSILLQDSDIHSDAKDSLAIVMASSRLLLTLINNMLDVRKCDANMMDEFKLHPVPISVSIQDAVDFCRPIASIANIDLKLAFGAAKDALVLSDPLRLQQIVINLLSNAIKYTNHGNSVLIETQVINLSQAERIINNSLACGPEIVDGPTTPDMQSESKVLVVSVIDCGEGISPEQSSRIFEKFSQLQDKRAANPIGGNKAVGQPSGTGLGLNLCRKFVHRMKGRIWVANCTDRPGSCFSFYVPLASEDSSSSNVRTNGRCGGLSTNTVTQFSRPASSSCPSPSLVGDGDYPAGRKFNPDCDYKQRAFHSKDVVELDRSTRRLSSAADFRVLVVDDTIINLKVLERMLKRIGVGKITTVDSGRKALAVLEQGYYDLVITDIQMPEMSGTELSFAIFKSQTIKGRPIVVGLTAETSENLSHRCSASGMITVLHKPITTYQMQDFFENLSPGLLKKNDVIIDPRDGLTYSSRHPPVTTAVH